MLGSYTCLSRFAVNRETNFPQYFSSTLDHKAESLNVNFFVVVDERVGYLAANMKYYCRGRYDIKKEESLIDDLSKIRRSLAFRHGSLQRSELGTSPKVPSGQKSREFGRKGLRCNQNQINLNQIK